MMIHIIMNMMSTTIMEIIKTLTTLMEMINTSTTFIGMRLAAAVGALATALGLVAGSAVAAQPPRHRPVAALVMALPRWWTVFSFSLSVYLLFSF